MPMFFAANGWLLASSTAAILAAALYGLTVAGQFPAEHRALQLRGSLGVLVLWASMLLAAAAAIVTLWAMRALPWPIVIIAAGGALLVAPLILQCFPDDFVNDRRGLLAFAGLAAALALVAMRMVV